MVQTMLLSPGNSVQRASVCLSAPIFTAALSNCTHYEGGARAGRARPIGEGGPVVDPVQAPASDVPDSTGEAVGPHRALHPVVPCKEKHCALNLVVPCREKQDSGGEVTRTKIRIT